MRRVAQFACAWLIMSGVVLASDSDLVRLTEVVANAKRNLAADCSSYRAQLPTAEGFKARNRAEQGIIVSCECMPAELDKIVADESVPRELTRGDSKALVLGRMPLCGMRAMRKTFAESCPTLGAPPDVRDPAGFCKCYLDEMGQYSDEQLLADTVKLGDTVKAQQAARAAGKPPPPDYRGLSDGFLARCHARWRRK
jgi:hypothetical protein